MGYYGSVQVICENGHYTSIDYWYWLEYKNDHDDIHNCKHCNAPDAWVNHSDETNICAEGYIPRAEIDARFMIQPSVNGSPAIYRIPSLEETNPLRHVLTTEESEEQDRYYNSNNRS